MYENLSVPTTVINPYETILSSPSKNNTQPAIYVSLGSNSPASIRTNSQETNSCTLTTPPFQKKFPIILIGVLGFAELIAGLLVLTLELLVFDLAIGLWCGAIYALAGAAVLVLVIGTDCERHQTTVVLIFQFIALMFAITELLLHSDLYRKRCLIRANEPTRPMTFQCQILIIQMAAAALILICSMIFSMIYIRLTMIVLKQPHGTLNMSNVLHLSSC